MVEDISPTNSTLSNNGNLRLLATLMLILLKLLPAILTSTALHAIPVIPLPRLFAGLLTPNSNWVKLALFPVIVQVAILYPLSEPLDAGNAEAV